MVGLVGGLKGGSRCLGHLIDYKVINFDPPFLFENLLGCVQFMSADGCNRKTQAQ